MHDVSCCFFRKAIFSDFLGDRVEIGSSLLAFDEGAGCLCVKHVPRFDRGNALACTKKLKSCGRLMTLQTDVFLRFSRHDSSRGVVQVSSITATISLGGWDSDLVPMITVG